jgi:type VI secretion system protein VasD
MLKKVNVQVERDTGQAQRSMYASSLTTEFFFNSGRAAASAGVQIVQPARSVQITVRADPALNSDSRKQPRKSVLWVYVLRSTATFQKAAFDTLYERAEATLGPELLGKEKLNLTPGESYQLPLDLASSARALGVLVAYREPDGDGWKALLPLAASGPAAAPPLQLRIDAGARSVSIALVG